MSDWLSDVDWSAVLWHEVFGVPVFGLVVLGCGAALYMLMSRATSSPSPAVPTLGRPGWVARQRAWRGVEHPEEGGATIGYRSALARVALSPEVFALGGLVLGMPGSGKTSLVRLLCEALAWQGTAAIVLDPKHDEDLAATVRGVGGLVWTMGVEDLVLDLLPREPTALADQLLEVEPADPAARVYRNSARLQMLVAGQALQRAGLAPTVERLAALCRPGALERLLERQGRLQDMPRFQGAEREGVLSYGTGLQILARGIAGRSLGAGPGALRLEDAIARGQVVLLQLDSPVYPDESRTIGAWCLRAMLRLLRLPQPCVVIADEFGRLGYSGRHALELLAVGRATRKAAVLLSQGPSDFQEIGPQALQRAVQDSGWTLAYRQAPLDAPTTAQLLGHRHVPERTWLSDGRESVRMVERAWCSASDLEALVDGDAVLRLPPVGRQRAPSVTAVRVAMPQVSGPLPVGNGPQVTVTPVSWPALAAPSGQAEPERAIVRVENVGTYGSAPGHGSVGTAGTAGEASAPRLTREQLLLRDPEAAAEFWRQVGRSPGHVMFWLGTRDHKGYGRFRWKGKEYKAHRLVWTAQVGPIGEAVTLDHRCRPKIDHRCCTVAHLRPMSARDNTRARWARENEGTRDADPNP